MNVILCIACAFAMLMPILPAMEVKAEDTVKVFGEFMYLNEKGETVDVYHEFEGVSGEITCKDFYEKYMVPYVAELKDLKTPDSWHSAPLFIGGSYEASSWMNSGTPLKDAVYYGYGNDKYARMEYFGLYSGYTWVCYGYEVLYGEENWLERFR